ncbi:MAG: 3-oxoacyl-[acyl-carrier-protein] synthase III C-terminal domain-containing protein [Pseudomonadota bacterium]
MSIGIEDIAVYLPRRRMARHAIAEAHAWAVPSLKHLGRGRNATANWDEDSVTLAHAACRQIATGTLDSLKFCSTSQPFADRSHAALLAEALAQPRTLRTMDVSASARAGTSALQEALTGDANALVVAAERRLAKPGSVEEISYGDAAVAIRTGRTAGIAEFIGSVSSATDFVDHYRSSGASFDYGFEARWVRDEGQLPELPQLLPDLMRAHAVSSSDVRWLAMNAPKRVRQKLAKELSLESINHDMTFEAHVGQCGSAEPLLGLAECLSRAKAGDVVVCVGFGQGLDVLLFRATGQSPSTDVMALIEGGVEDTNYLRFLSHRGLIDMDWGKRAERDVRTAQSAYYRERDQIAGFVGGCCKACGTIQFPRTRVCVNPECRAVDTQVPHPFADLTGTVKSFTEDWQAYSPAPPLIYGNIGFEGGANILMQFTDTDQGATQVGDQVAMQFRIKDFDRVRNFRRYFWKAVPVEGATDG